MGLGLGASRPRLSFSLRDCGRLRPNYVFKPTAEGVARIVQAPSRGDGLTRR
jgi:hypothetical protein